MADALQAVPAHRRRRRRHGAGVGERARRRHHRDLRAEDEALPGSPPPARERGGPHADARPARPALVPRLPQRQAGGDRVMAVGAARAADVVVVGGGNAALCAALAAREGGARVMLLEKAPRPERGGTSFFPAGGFRFAHGGLEDLRRDILTDLSAEEAASVEVAPYPEGTYYDDLVRLTEHLADADLLESLVTRSRATMAWMRGQGVRWILMLARQSYLVGAIHRFWCGLNVEAVGGGPGLVQTLFDRAEAAGIDVRYETKATRLHVDAQAAVRAVEIRGPAGFADLPAGAVVLACGGFEANPEWRTRYLGPGWELARVRGTRYNTGDGIRMALEVGAQPYGNW